MKQLSELSGLDFLQGIIDGEVPQAPIAELLNFAPVEVEFGRVVFAGEPGPEHYNPIGSVHGGYAATLLDSAMGCAVHSTLDPGSRYSTLELSVNLVRPITAETGRVLAEGRILHAGRRSATAEGRLIAEETGKLLAHGTTTCMIS